MSSGKKPSSLGTLLQQFFSHYLQDQKNVSQCTVASYRDTFRLLFLFAEQELRKRPAELTLADVDSKLVLSFLAHLEIERKNTVRTRNSRLAAIRSFIHFVSFKEPMVLADCVQILAIPPKRYERPLIGYLSREQVKAILVAPDESTWSGQRDRVMLSTLYNTGARVSELIRIRASDLTIGDTSTLRIHGKGRKLRTVPIWKNTVKQLRQWMEVNAITENMILFPNRKAQQLTRTGITDRLMLATQRAAINCTSLKNHRVTPHIIRHSTAMHLLQSGVDITIIALWLGHESTATTHGYIEADLAMKEKALNTLAPEVQSHQRFQASDKLIAFLDKL